MHAKRVQNVNINVYLLQYQQQSCGWEWSGRGCGGCNTCVFAAVPLTTDRCSRLCAIIDSVFTASEPVIRARYVDAIDCMWKCVPHETLWCMRVCVCAFLGCGSYFSFRIYRRGASQLLNNWACAHVQVASNQTEIICVSISQVRTKDVVRKLGSLSILYVLNNCAHILMIGFYTIQTNWLIKSLENIWVVTCDEKSIHCKNVFFFDTDSMPTVERYLEFSEYPEVKSSHPSQVFNAISVVLFEHFIPFKCSCYG